MRLFCTPERPFKTGKLIFSGSKNTTWWHPSTPALSGNGPWLGKAGAPPKRMPFPLAACIPGRMNEEVEALPSKGSLSFRASYEGSWGLGEISLHPGFSLCIICSLPFPRRWTQEHFLINFPPQTLLLREIATPSPWTGLTVLEDDNLKTRVSLVRDSKGLIHLSWSCKLVIFLHTTLLIMLSQPFLRMLVHVHVPAFLLSKMLNLMNIFQFWLEKLHEGSELRSGDPFYERRHISLCDIYLGWFHH